MTASRVVIDLVFLGALLTVLTLPLVAYGVAGVAGWTQPQRPMSLGGGGRLLGPLLVRYYTWLLRPAITLGRWFDISPNQVTALSLLVSVAGGVAIACGRLHLACALVATGGTLDMVDGQLARAGNRQTNQGAFLDSVADRLADGAIFGGCVLYYAGTWMMVVALIALVTSFAISYARARGESLGVTGAGGLMQRADRLVLLAVALAFAPLVADVTEPTCRPLFAVLAVALCSMAGLNLITFVARARFTVRELGRAGRPLPSSRPGRDGRPTRGAAGNAVGPTGGAQARFGA